MLRGTLVKVVWRGGITLEVLCRGIAEFSARHGLTLMPPGDQKRGHLPPRGQKPYYVTCFSGSDGASSTETDDIIGFRPFDDPRVTGVCWELFDAAGGVWFWFSVRKKSLIAGRVGTLHIALDEGYFSLMREEDAPNAITKYHQLKELFKLLHADALSATCSTAGGERFRFANEGRQVLIGPMEERRRPRPEEEREGTFKIVFDPPVGRDIA